ncbi:MAG: exodeoxyribonuclease VII large subunit [Dehalococcoidia bacterium]
MAPAVQYIAMQLYTVTELAEYVKGALERDPQLRDIWVTGEVSNCTRSGAGHCYFTVKDNTAAFRAVLFRGNTGEEHVDNGAQINAHGRVSFYTVRGETQMYVDTVVPAGLGALAAEFERLRGQLEKEGLFDPSRKRPLPLFPKRIGVVTSERGAVIHDIQNVLMRRYPLAEIVLCAATVQGDDAPGEIVDAIRTLNEQKDIDVLIVGRGGGSIEDLWAFNTEPVARAIHASRIPLVSAVGHESDYTIADFVADYRAPTPSAAAEAVSPDITGLSAEVLMLTRRSHQAVSHLLAQRLSQVEGLVDRMRSRLPDTASQRQRVDDVLERGKTALSTLVRYRREQVSSLEQALSALNPAAVLARGFAAITDPKTKRAITSVTEVAQGDIVRATVSDGAFDAEVRASKDTGVNKL